MLSLADALVRPAEASGSAPGRVNLLGEHTDYSGGFVLPTAIPQRAHVELAHSPDGDFHVHSASLGRQVVFAPDDAVPDDFARYVYGCIAVLRQRGIEVPPLSMRIDSTVPIGVGLSSSAPPRRGSTPMRRSLCARRTSSWRQRARARSWSGRWPR